MWSQAPLSLIAPLSSNSTPCTRALPSCSVPLATLSVQNTKPMPRISFSFKRLSAFSMCFEEIVTLLCSDIHHNVSTAEASGRFYFSDNDQLLFPVLKTKVEQMQRSSVFILTMQELHYIFAITSGHYLSTCPFFLIILWTACICLSWYF